MMKRIFRFFLFILLTAGMMACARKEESKKTDAMVSGEPVVLWNGQNFTGWTFYLADTTVPSPEVWSVREGNLSCAGVPNGYIRTEQEFSDYLLTLEWRWMEEPGNSGVLLHVQKPDAIWPVCIEGQLKSGDAGDVYLIGGTSVKEQTDKQSPRIVKRQDSSENEPGAWNRYEITCNADSIRLVVNDVLQNVVSGASVIRGHIALQSEGKPIEFRNITVTPLK